MKRISRLLIAALLLAACGSSGTSSGANSGTGNTSSGTSSDRSELVCGKGVDDFLSVLVAAKRLSRITQDQGYATLAACNKAESWREYAKADHIADALGLMGAMNGQLMDEGDALNYLCTRFDKTNKTNTCKTR